MKKIFHAVMAFLLTSGLFAIFWHFGDVYGTEYTWTMPANLLVKLFFSYWGVKAVLILAGIYTFYFIFVAIGRWHQNSLEKAVEKALAKHL